MTVVSDSDYQSTLNAVYVCVVSWSELPIVPSYPHYPQVGGWGFGSEAQAREGGVEEGGGRVVEVRCQLWQHLK